jgi:hypothetical protein
LRLKCIVVAAAVLLTPASVSAAGRPTPSLQGVNFISVCGFSHMAPDDPIVSPGRPGASHPHTFVGNTSTNASSSLESLRSAGTTCSRPGDKAAYWMPTLFVRAAPVVPTGAVVYYQRRVNANVKPFPPGLEMIAGDAHALAPQSILVTFWDCGDATDVARSSRVPSCPQGSALRLRVNFPDCWNGVALDSPDHRAHMAYSVGGRCPRTHPVPVPAISLVYRYPVPDVPSLADVFLASGGQWSAHADFVNAWDQPALARLVAICLNRYRHCGTGS